MGCFNQTLKHIACFPIRLYQSLIRPILPSACRFYPSCSHYAIESIDSHGVIKGFFYTLRRLFRCHPFHLGGYDPVPKKREK